MSYPGISLIMIVKNEAKYLEKSLISVIPHVDEIVIVDTGSTDDTLNIARSYTDKIYSFPWQDDFSAARNYAIKQATGEWLLSLDADEELVAEKDDLRKLALENNTQSNMIEAYFLPLLNKTSESTGEGNHYYVLRFFRNNGRYYFSGCIHEQLVLPDSQIARFTDRPLIIHNLLPAKERQAKRARNLTLLQKTLNADPDNPFLHYYLGVEWLMLGKPRLALPCLNKAYLSLTDDYLLFRAPALRYLIMCLHALGQLDKALCLCLDAGINYPKFTDIYYLGGVLFEEKNEFLLAIKWLSQAIKCGTPPPIYSHMSGTGSFLAYYHLGYCYEKLGRLSEAKDAYQQALSANPHYVFPLYNLFLVSLVQYGPEGSLTNLQEQRYIDGSGQNNEITLIIAELYFRTGFPGLARRSLVSDSSAEKSEIELFYLGKFNIYSGRLTQGISFLQKLNSESKFHEPSLILIVIALLLTGQFSESQSLIRRIWQNKETRQIAMTLLSLSSLIKQEIESTTINKDFQVPTLSPALNNRNSQSYHSALELLSEISRYLPDLFSEHTKQPEHSEIPRFHFLQPEKEGNIISVSQLSNRLLLKLEALCTGGPPQSYAEIADFYREKSKGMQGLLELKFGTGWR